MRGAWLTQLQLKLDGQLGDFCADISQTIDACKAGGSRGGGGGVWMRFPLCRAAGVTSHPARGVGLHCVLALRSPPPRVTRTGGDSGRGTVPRRSLRDLCQGWVGFLRVRVRRGGSQKWYPMTPLTHALLPPVRGLYEASQRIGTRWREGMPEHVATRTAPPTQNHVQWELLITSLDLHPITNPTGHMHDPHAPSPRKAREKEVQGSGCGGMRIQADRSSAGVRVGCECEYQVADPKPQIPNIPRGRN
jgi:hypothetical protein